MSQTFLSPGVETVEIDQSFLEQGVPQPGAIMIGRTKKGPAFYPITVRNFDQFTAMFGGTDPSLQMPYAARNYLRNSNSMTVLRVLGHSDGTSTTNGYAVGSTFGIVDTSGTNGTTGSLLAVIHANVPLSGVSVAGVPLDSNRFVVRIGTGFAATASFLTSSDDYIGKSLNTDPTKYGTYGHYVYQVFPFAKPAASASWSAVNSISASFTAFNRNYDHGRTTLVKSQPLGGIEYDLFQIHTFGRGRASNDDVKVQIDNVKPSSAPSSQPYGTFDIVVRSFYDTEVRPIELERFANLNLDPSSPNYFLKKIGDVYEIFDTSTRKFIKQSGSYPLKSRYIFVQLNDQANFPPQALPWGFRGYAKPIFSGSATGNGTTFGISVVPPLPYVPNQFDANGNYNPNIAWGVSFVSGGIADRMRALPDGNISSFITGTDPDFSLSNLSASYINGNIRYSYLGGWGRYSPIFASASMQSFTMPFAGGFDGWDLRVQDPLYLNNSDTDSVIGVVSLKRAIDCVANPDQVTGDVIALPGQHNISVTDYVRQLANARRDMFYVMDLTGSSRQEVVANLNAREIDDNYTSAYYPDLVYTDMDGRVIRVPPSVGVMGALAYNDHVSQAFFAPAGLNRGGLSQFGITDIVDRLNHDDRDALYEARINPITKFPVEGIVIFGQKTLQLRPSALDRVNVRRLLILAKRAVAGFARGLLFEPNNPATWTRFANKVNPVLEQYRRDQGINRFKVVMDSTTNTSDVIDRNEMKGKIFLEPVRAAEYITIDFVITPSGVAFGS